MKKKITAVLCALAVVFGVALTATPATAAVVHSQRHCTIGTTVKMESNLLVVGGTQKHTAFDAYSPGVKSYVNKGGRYLKSNTGFRGGNLKFESPGRYMYTTTQC